MKVQRMIELLKTEHQCMLRNSHGDCDRNCDDCDLVHDDSELDEMYVDVIGILEEKNKEVETKMNDLISRSALLEAYDKAHQGPPGGARKLIEEAPEAIVRCERCWKRSFDNCPFNEYSLVVPKDDFFCGAGEREMKNEE